MKIEKNRHPRLNLVDLNENEQRLLHFTLDCLHGENERLIDEYVAVDYIQHTAGIGQGREGLRRYVKAVAWRRPGRFEVEVLHLFSSGDFAMLHKLLPKVQVVDIMRFDNKHRFVEHWDVVQPLHSADHDPMSLSTEDLGRFRSVFW